MGRVRRPVRGVVTAAGVLLCGFLSSGADAAQRIVPRIESFGPYKLGMKLAEAQAADKGAKRQDCGDIAPDRQCLALDAAVFEEPAVIYAVLDEGAARVERIVAQMDPQLTRRRAYRCVRLSEKVFALLVVVYGSKYKQSYDQNRKPLPAVAWDGAEAGRLVFETRCKTPDEGNPRISVIEHYPGGVKPPPALARNAPKERQDWPAQTPTGNALDATSAASDVPLSVEGQETAPQAATGPSQSIALAAPGEEPPPPLSAPVGVVEELPVGAPDTAGAVDASAMAALTRELKQAKGKVPEIAKAPPSAAAVAEPVSAPAEEPASAAAPVAAAPAASEGPDDARHPEGSHVIPVDIAPPPSADTPPQSSVALAPPLPDDGPPRRDTPPPGAAPPSPPSPIVALAPPQPLAAAVDPGPVTFRPPSPAAADATNAPVPVPAPAAAAPATTDAVPLPRKDPSTAAREAVAEAAPQARAETPVRPGRSKPEAAPVVVARTNPQRALPEQRPSAAARGFDPAAPGRTALLQPAVRAPSYEAPGTARVPTDLEAPEPFTVPEDEAAFRGGAASGTAAASPATAPAPAPALSPASAGAPTLEAEVRRRLASAGNPSAAERTPPLSQTRQPEHAAAAPISLLSVAREGPAGGSSQRPSAVQEAAPQASAQPQAAPGPGTSVARAEPAIAPVTETPAPQKTAPATPAPAPQSAADGAGAETKGPATPIAPNEATESGWSMAAERRFAPVLSGGWRYRAPVPPAKPWRERAEAPESATSGG